jgi:pimeloyl-ACP methyl ester carboxylesterase
VRLHAEVDGPPDGAPVVFLHGVSGSTRTYAWLTGAITEGRRIVRLDLRGHGRSEHARISPPQAPIGCQAVLSSVTASRRARASSVAAS